MEKIKLNRIHLPLRDGKGNYIFEREIHTLPLIAFLTTPQKPIFQIPIPELFLKSGQEGLFKDLLLSLNALEGVETGFFEAPKITIINKREDGNIIAKLEDGIIEIQINPEFRQAIDFISVLRFVWAIEKYPIISRDDWLDPELFSEVALKDQEKVNIIFNFEYAAKYDDPRSLTHEDAVFSPLIFQEFIESTYRRVLVNLITSLENIFWGNKSTRLIKIPTIE
ncbi:hypothetical protein KO317_02210 [Candidatus Micrarchaeota archaeon]|nr:hypothetical protein [Candidatus Micrarchaeota archaeon]